MKPFSVQTVFALILAAGAAGAASAQAVEDGASYFTTHCQMCHTKAPGQRSGAGPNLFGVANRKAGSGANYNYSAALKSSKLVWNAKTLDKFLATPGTVVPGTMMVVSIPDAAQRQKLIAYLMTLKK
jgi:cytochrome c